MLALLAFADFGGHASSRKPIIFKKSSEVLSIQAVFCYFVSLIIFNNVNNVNNRVAFHLLY